MPIWVTARTPTATSSCLCVAVPFVLPFPVTCMPCFFRLYSYTGYTYAYGFSSTHMQRVHHKHGWIRTFLLLLLCIPFFTSLASKGFPSGYSKSVCLLVRLHSENAEPTLSISQTTPDEHPPDAIALPMASSHHFANPR